MLEARQRLRIVRQMLGQDLDGDFAVQAGIPRAVNFSHTARADGREDLVGADAVACREGHMDDPLCYTSSPTDRINSSALLFSTTPACSR